MIARNRRSLCDLHHTARALPTITERNRRPPASPAASARPTHSSASEPPRHRPARGLPNTADPSPPPRQIGLLVSRALVLSPAQGCALVDRWCSAQRLDVGQEEIRWSNCWLAPLAAIGYRAARQKSAGYRPHSLTHRKSTLPLPEIRVCENRYWPRK